MLKSAGPVLPFAVVAAAGCAYAAAGGCIARNAPRITPRITPTPTTTIVENLAAAAAIIANFINA
jgi:hypothetical protein